MYISWGHRYNRTEVRIKELQFLLNIWGTALTKTIYVIYVNFHAKICKIVVITCEKQRNFQGFELFTKYNNKSMEK